MPKVNSTIRARTGARRLMSLLTLAAMTQAVFAAPQNLLKNPGFEEPGADSVWTTPAFSKAPATPSGLEAHSGARALAIPANSAVEQAVGGARAGAYLARCWVKSEAAQRVTLMLKDPDRPWAAYACADIQVPKGAWTQIEVECPLDQDGRLNVMLGGTSEEFRYYQGAGADMKAPILADDFELVRYEPPTPPRAAAWDAKIEGGGAPDWSSKAQWAVVEGASRSFVGTPVFQTRHLAGYARKQDGAIAIYAIQPHGLQPRGVIAPFPAFQASGFEWVGDSGRAGIRVSSSAGGPSYTAWLMDVGGVKIESSGVARFVVEDCRLRHGLLPSFAGTDLHLDPAKMSGVREAWLPSTQWFVGLGDGRDSMLVAVWDHDSQAVSLGLKGAGAEGRIDSLTIDTAHGGFALSFVEHPGIWGREALLEDWLGEYTPLAWEMPFPARWMADFFLTPGGKPNFHEPYNEYSFPVANAKTRMWGVWFEDWNHYPFYFDGSRTVAHFEKSFIPNGEALFYFLEPAAADLFSPCEIVQAALGREKAAALFDFEANRLRKLSYSTPDEMIYDRPVCATTTRLSHIKQEERAAVGINLATHLYEFIREIRGRVDQYNNCFKQIKNRLEEAKTAHPELGPFVAELEGLVSRAERESGKVYVTPLDEIRTKSEGIKKRLVENKGDGFDCAELDLRGPAGEQDDLCRRYNRFLLRLSQLAAARAVDSPEKALVAQYIWSQSRDVLRRPTRWESRRTLYFFEP